jgi:hypothetical protein
VTHSSGQTNRDDNDWQKLSSHPGKFTNTAFHYDAAHDVYHCPAGRELIFFYQEHDALGRLSRIFKR